MQRTLLRTFVLSVPAAAVAVLVVLPGGGMTGHVGTVLLLAFLTGLVGARPVEISALGTKLTATHPFELCAMAAFGPLAGAIVSASGVVGATVGQRKKLDGLRLTFNLGVIVLANSVAASVFLLLGGRFGSPVLDAVGPLTGATAAYFVVNTGLVAVAIAIEKTQDFLETWRRSFLWTTVSFFSGLTLAAGLLTLLQLMGPWALALGVPPAWLLFAFHRAYKARLEEQRRRIVEVETLNAELEQKVAERTRELQSAFDRIEEANQKLRDVNQRLYDANRAKSEFLANVSHELRTPLNGILGFSDLLVDSNFGELTRQQREFVNDIRDSGEHLLELINDILDLSKIEVGKMKTHRQVIDVPETLRDVTSMMRSLAAKGEIELTVEVEDSVGAGNLDRGMFRQILVNLISNAVKFTPEGGRVTVRGKREDNTLRVSVSDTGIGIAPDDQKKIFQEFYQVDGSYSRKYQGTGLGLALVHSMVELHGGTIAVDSEPDEGSTFTCVFPDCMVETPALEPSLVKEIPPPPVATGERTILMVEDNDLNRKLARNALRSRSYRVLEAKTGPEALEMARKHLPDLILMDVQLPDMDGLEATRRLKADPTTTHIRVVALSAFARTDDQDRAREAGCDGYITKPIRLSSFPAQVDSHFVAMESVA
jgi:signal transduction histidine kinase/CheY-like chemotaxis protein